MKKKKPNLAPEPKKSASVASVNLAGLDAWSAGRIKWRNSDGVYHDRSYRCCDCRMEFIWDAWEQKEWFEEMKGDAFWSAPVRCSACLAKARSKPAKRRKRVERAPVDATKWQDWRTLETRFPDGFYYDTPYICRTCGEVKIWTALQQKYWFEEKKGRSDTSAIYCLECREKYSQKKAEARRISAESLAKKRARQAQNNT